MRHTSRYHTHLPLFLCTTCNPLINVFSIKVLLAYASARVSVCLVLRLLLLMCSLLKICCSKAYRYIGIRICPCVCVSCIVLGTHK